jgi:hypothetical protein
MSQLAPSVRTGANPQANAGAGSTAAGSLDAVSSATRDKQRGITVMAVRKIKK